MIKGKNFVIERVCIILYPVNEKYTKQAIFVYVDERIFFSIFFEEDVIHVIVE